MDSRPLVLSQCRPDPFPCLLPPNRFLPLNRLRGLLPLFSHDPLRDPLHGEGNRDLLVCEILQLRLCENMDMRNI